MTGGKGTARCAAVLCGSSLGQLHLHVDVQAGQRRQRRREAHQRVGAKAGGGRFLDERSRPISVPHRQAISVLIATVPMPSARMPSNIGSKRLPSVLFGRIGYGRRLRRHRHPCSDSACAAMSRCNSGKVESREGRRQLFTISTPALSARRTARPPRTAWPSGNGSCGPAGG